MLFVEEVCLLVLLGEENENVCLMPSRQDKLLKMPSCLKMLCTSLFLEHVLRFV